MQASGPRIIVFEVSGRIRLASNLTLASPYLTIAGQTAPSPGIQITERTLVIQTHDVLLQHLRVRPGDENKTTSEAWGACDAIRISGAGAYNIVLDHVTANWSIDGTLDITSEAHDITVLDSLVAEPLDASVHPEGRHAFLSLIKYDVQRIALARNFMGNAIVRFPLFAGGSLLFANNLVYNAGNSKPFSLSGSADYMVVPTYGSFVNNVYKDGPRATPRAAVGADAATLHPSSAVYSVGNTYDAGAVDDTQAYYVSAPPADTWPTGFAPMSTSEVQAYVVQHVGARPAERDAVELRLLDEMQTNRGHLTNSQAAVGGFPAYAQVQRAFVAGSNPNGDGDGYTNVEELLHDATAAVEGR